MSRGWLLLFGLIGASLIPLVLGGSDMFPRLRAFPLDSLLLMFGMIVVCWFINGLRLRLLLAGRAGKLGQLQSVGIIMASEFAFCATPGGSGGPLTLMALLARRGLRPAQTSAVFAVDQLADLTFFLCALGAILIYALSHSLSPNMESSLIFSAVFLVGLFVGAVMLIRYLHQVIRFNGRVLARLGVSSRKRLHWGRKILHFRIALHDSLRLPKRRLLAVFLLSSTHWLLRFSVLDLTLRGLGVDIQWAWTFLIQMVSLSAGQLADPRRRRRHRADLGGPAGPHDRQVDGGGGHRHLASGDLLFLPRRRRPGVRRARRTPAAEEADQQSRGFFLSASSALASPVSLALSWIRRQSSAAPGNSVPSSSPRASMS